MSHAAALISRQLGAAQDTVPVCGIDEIRDFERHRRGAE
jgi:hypothetical protein